MTEKPPMVSSGRHMRSKMLKSARIKWIALFSTCMLLVVLGYGGAVALRWRANLKTNDINIAKDVNGVETGALDILIIGSDTRAGTDGSYGDDDGEAARSDVIMLLHISKDRKNVNSLSFPRDLIVSIPECTDPESKKVYPAEEHAQINESLSHGGPGCTVGTVSKLTGVQIDHFMLVDFNAVKELSKVVGGVEVCVDKPIDDEYTQLKLPAGKSSVEGEQALAFLRSRHGFGDGSDIGRIQAQQGFMAALLRKVKKEGTLSDFSRMNNIAEAITQNVTVDTALGNVNELISIGNILGGIDLSQVVFATVPTEPWEQDPNRLQVTSEADAVFKKLQEDKSLKVEAPPAEAAPQEQKAPADHATPVNIMNATGLEGRGATIAKVVTDLGYASVTPGSAAENVQFSSVTYAPGHETEAREIAGKLNISRVEESAASTGVTVTVGTDFPKGEAMEKQESQIAGNATGQTADQETCQQAFAFN